MALQMGAGKSKCKAAFLITSHAVFNVTEKKLHPDDMIFVHHAFQDLIPYLYLSVLFQIDNISLGSLQSIRQMFPNVPWDIITSCAEKATSVEELASQLCEYTEKGNEMQDNGLEEGNICFQKFIGYYLVAVWISLSSWQQRYLDHEGRDLSKVSPRL